MMKDNFSNPNPFLSQAKQFQELVNQPTAGDAMADANIRSMIPNPRNEGEILANSLSSGFAGGLKAHENQKRQEKMSPMLERAGQITAKAAELEAQMQDETQTKMDTEKFYRRVAPAMLERSKAALAGATSAVSELDKYIYGVLQQSINDPSLGNYSHSNGSDTYFTNNETGVTEGRNLMQTMYQYGIDPAQIFGKDAMNVEIGYSPGAKLKYEDERKMLAAELAQKNSVTSVNNAHAGNYNAQTEKTKHEMNAPKSKYDDKTLSHIRKENSEWVNSLYAKHKDAKKAITAQTQMRDAIQGEIDNGSWSAGSGAIASAARWANAKTGNNKTQQLLELKRQPLFKDLKNTFGARITDNDLATWMSTQVDLGNDPKLAIDTLNQRIQESETDLQEELIRREVLENDFGNSESYNALPVDQIVQERLNQNNATSGINSSQGSAQNEEMVVAEDPDTGEQQKIPVKSIEEAKNRGLIIKQ